MIVRKEEVYIHTSLVTGGRAGHTAAGEEAFGSVRSQG